MKIVLATSNSGKVKEIKEFCNEYDVIAYSDLIEPFEIVEDGESFASNALIKARAVYKALHDSKALVLADDSGISIEAFDGAPGLYSARFAGVGASDKQNLQKVITQLQEKQKTQSNAYYTAAIAIVTEGKEFVVHGWMYGSVVDTPRGDGGFGYDPIFIPKGFNKTLGELPSDVKKGLSHRSKAIELAKVILKKLAA